MAPSKEFCSYLSGVAARRYIDLFSMRLGLGMEIVRKVKGTGVAVSFSRSLAKLRVPLVVISYLDSEKYAISRLRGGLLNGKSRKKKV
jgi:hypothetical protein